MTVAAQLVYTNDEAKYQASAAPTQRYRLDNLVFIMSIPTDHNRRIIITLTDVDPDKHLFHVSPCQQCRSEAT
jgi:hypothetical protein